MNRIRTSHSIALALALLAFRGGAAQAQSGAIVAGANPEADRLAQDVRLLAADPRDINALLDAGLRSARLNDTAAALAFFQRAESVSPGDPRILSGRASALVRSERPGEALRMFQTAEARGVPVRDHAADRGFAYDLLGQPTLAQADYRVALQQERDDETLRRLALSQGISGQVDQAMATLDPLLRRSDRAAWRARAFILAMNGDVPAAERIASSMMPGNMGQSLTPFFRRLAVLTPADRAFAVHFGELSPTQARLADARFAPALPAYVAPARPVQVAAVRAPAAVERKGRDRRSKRDRERDRQLAAAAPVRVAAAALPLPPSALTVQPLPAQSVARVASVQAVPTPTPRGVMVQPLPTPSPSLASIQALPASSVTRAIVQPTPAPTPIQVASVEPSRAIGLPEPMQTARNVVPVAREAVVPVTRQAAPQAAPTELAQAQRTSPPAERDTVVRTGTPAAPSVQPTLAPVEVTNRAAVVATGDTAPRTASPVRPALTAATVAPTPVAEPAAAAVSPASEPAPPGPAKVGQEDAVLAAIVAGISIPAEELQAVTAEPTAPVPEPEPVRPAPAPAPAKPDVEKPTIAKAKPAVAKAEPKTKPELDDAKAKPDKGVGKGKTTAVGKVDAKGKALPAAKEDPKAKKPDPKAKDVAKGEPKRVWVQVAGGANQDTLPKAWKAAVAKAPGAFKGKAGWSMPLRATNRVMTGPFKTAAEAQAFVNSLGKSGLSAFVVTSDAGQKVTKLPAN